jgi:hypothetical protein
MSPSDLCREDVDLCLGRVSNPNSLSHIILTELSWLFTYVTASNDTDLFLPVNFCLSCHRMTDEWKSVWKERVIA